MNTAFLFNEKSGKFYGYAPLSLRERGRGEGIKVSNPPGKAGKPSVCYPFCFAALRVPNPSPTRGGAFQRTGNPAALKEKDS